MSNVAAHGSHHHFVLFLVPATAWGVHQLPVLPPLWLAPAFSFGLCVTLLGAGVLLRRFELISGSGSSRLTDGAVIVLLICLTANFVVWSADRALSERLPVVLEGKDLLVTGQITGLIRSFDAGTGFDFDIQACVTGPVWCQTPKRIRLSWYGRYALAATPRVGQRWQFTVRLKRPHAPFNPGAFDAELRALQSSIAARGYVRAGSKRTPLKRKNAPIAAKSLSFLDWVDRARAQTAEQMSDALRRSSDPVRGTLIALVTGDQSAIPATSWQQYNRTGTSHLMSISGLHVTFFAALTLLILRRLLRLPFVMPSAVLVRVPAPAITALLAAAAAFSYSLFSGWGIPAQRTSLMLLIAGLALHSGRQRSIAAVMAPAAAAVVLLDPWAPLAAGFWLSFVAVGAIVAAAQGVRQHLESNLLQASRTQWAATIALVPLGAIWFGTFSIVSPLANAIAIPVISAVVTPLALLGAALQWIMPANLPLGRWLLQLIAWPTTWLMKLLEWMSSLPNAVLVVGQPQVWVLALGALGCWVLLTPFRPIARWTGALMLLPLMVLPVDALEHGQWRVLSLDVGQGNAVLVQTRNHALLFDTGPSFGVGTGAGDRTILPVLHARGIARIDTLMISHRDLDHVGGASSVLQTFQVGRLLTSMGAEHPVSKRAAHYVGCRRGQRWQWDGVAFEVLHPPTQYFETDRVGRVKKPPKSNALSCVLRITGPGGSALLAGDIESAQERLILNHYRAKGFQADVLVAPHHGSNTSSTAAFINAVKPRWVMFQMGYRNRFRHPTKKVEQRYRNAGAEILRSDQHGAVEWLFSAGKPVLVTRHRQARPRYWRVPVKIEESTQSETRHAQR